MALSGVCKKAMQYIFEMDADFSHNPADLNKACIMLVNTKVQMLQ
jgi:hypothetical protein